MGKHLFQRAFRDLLSLHGYPLPFESIEGLDVPQGGTGGSRGSGRRAEAASPNAASPGAPARGRRPAPLHATAPQVTAPRAPC